MSGQVALSPDTGEMEPGDARAEARRALQNLKATLEAAGFSMQECVFVEVLLVDIADWQSVNEVYVEYFGEKPPARMAYAVAELALGARVEIRAVAARG